MSTASEASSRPSLTWIGWIVGGAALGALVLAVVHFSEERQLAALLETVQPAWLLAALVIQTATYAAQGDVWRRVMRAGGESVALKELFQHSLTKLFVDQAVPSAGISGSVVVGRALEQRGVSRGTVMAGVVVSTISYHASNVLCLAMALAIVAFTGRLSAVLIVAAALFSLFVAALAVLMLRLAREGHAPKWSRLRRIGPLQRAFTLFEEARSDLVWNRQLLAQATALQMAIVVLDVATVWVLLRGLGASASPLGVFASFVVASLARTLAPVPGGLGVFEAASVGTLSLTGVSLPVALAATLLFRGLSFWLPMLPGLWLSRRVAKPRSTDTTRESGAGKYWAADPSEVARGLGVSLEGLSSAEAESRLREQGPNQLEAERSLSRLHVLLDQFRSPLLLLLLFAGVTSALSGEWADSGIVILIIVATVGIGSSREYSARAALAGLRAKVLLRTQVLRDGRPCSVPSREMVPGDVALLAAGSLVPADGVLIDATDCFVNEAVLTGESFPTEKRPGRVAAEATVRERVNCAFMGTNVRSGFARLLVVKTGASTQFGDIAKRLTLRPPETEFDRGIRHFGYLLLTAMLVMTLLVFAINVFLGRPAVETLLFSVALAVGLSPELLPAILTVNLAHGAQVMASHGVLVRRLNAIENLGSMDILCTDKTGTLTEGVVQLEGAYDAAGKSSAGVLDLAVCNAALQTGLPNPLDEAILRGRPAVDQAQKLAEIPYDFVRKRVSVIVKRAEGARLVTKGAFTTVLEACARMADGAALDEQRRRELRARYEEWGTRGIRVLAVADRTTPEKTSYTHDDERELSFLGFLTFLDRPKEGARKALADLAGLGVAVKLITGDSKAVAQYVADAVGMQADRVLTGSDLDRLHDDALWRAAPATDLFVEVDPNQKERIILALKKTRHVVGFLGDGVNDAPAMHGADTSLSVDQAVDVAKEAADFVLLERDLDVIRRGVQEGRKTFANTLKYILTTTSANLGNMISMAVASVMLPFLPLLAGQILLNNFLSDIPAIGLAGDSVDPEQVDRPRRWNMRFIGRFMIAFGAISSAFDFLTFGILLFALRAAAPLFRTAWFVESLLTELLVALVVRTQRPFFRSRPGRLLLITTAAVTVLAFAVPYLPFSDLLGFVHPSPMLMAIVACIAVSYVLVTELAKRPFYWAVSREAGLAAADTTPALRS